MIALPKQRAVSPLGHSADISMVLHVGEQIVPLAQTGSTALKLERDAEVPTGPARVEMTIDGRSYFTDVIVGQRKVDSLWLNIQLAAKA